MDDEKHVGNANASSISSPVPDDVQKVADAGGREAFLATFSAEEDKAIMRKVDKRFLLLIGVLYLTKNVGCMKSCIKTRADCFQIDYTNAASVKVLQVGQPRNILTELGMTSDQYNWVQSIYFVCFSFAF